jgi:hypothetical protein
MNKRFYYHTLGKDGAGKEIYEKIYIDWSGEIHFKNMAQVSLWNNELIGQMSDGQWENSHVSWEFWHGLEPMVKEPQGWITFDDEIPHHWGLDFYCLTEGGLDDRMILKARCGLAGIVDSDEVHAIESYTWHPERPDDNEVTKRLCDRFHTDMHGVLIQVMMHSYDHAALLEDLDYITETMDTSIRKIGYLD